MATALVSALDTACPRGRSGDDRGNHVCAGGGCRSVDSREGGGAKQAGVKIIIIPRGTKRLTEIPTYVKKG